MLQCMDLSGSQLHSTSSSASEPLKASQQQATTAAAGAAAAGSGGSRKRAVLVLKGFVHGIPEQRMQEALSKADALIREKGITTVCWDGDKLTYANPATGAPATASFTRLLPALHKSFPQLEFLF